MLDRVLVRKDDPGDEVGQDAATAAEREDDPDQADNGGIHVEVFRKSVADAADHFVVTGLVKSLCCHSISFLIDYQSTHHHKDN